MDRRSPVLGYDVDSRGGRLIVNEDEAARVRVIFDLYLEHRSLVAVAREVNDLGWTTKRWTSKAGRELAGQLIGKGDVYKILTNVKYTGQVNHKGSTYPGEHPAILDPTTFQKVNERLSHNGITGGKEVRNKYGALLRGLLHRDACGTAMHHTYTAEALKEFEPVWKSLNTNEQTRIIRAVIERVGYDGRTGKVAVTFRSAGLKVLCGGRG